MFSVQIHDLQFDEGSRGAPMSQSWWPGPRIDLGKLDSRVAVVNSGRCNVGAPGEASPVPRSSIGRTPKEKWIHPWLELGGTVSSRTTRRQSHFKGGMYPPLQLCQGPAPPVLLGEQLRQAILSAARMMALDLGPRLADETVIVWCWWVGGGVHCLCIDFGIVYRSPT